MAERPHHAPPSADGAPAIDLRERGLPIDGKPQLLDRRVFVQLVVFRARGAAAADLAAKELATAMAEGGVSGVIYADVNDPQSLGLATYAEDPAHFVEKVRPLFLRPGLGDVEFRPEFAMLGRSYSSGYENDLAFWLIERPVATLMHDGWDWAVWYPLRRTGAFNRLPREEQGAILREHGGIGRAYGELDLAHDIRLACHGIDANDNEFLIGLIGPQLYPLSHVVQAMRSTRQTSEYMQHMGPFFVGRVLTRVRGAGA